MRNINFLKITAIGLFAAGLIGCGGQGFKSVGSSGNVTATDITNEINKAEQANQAAMLALADANAALKDLTDANGNINVGLFSGGTQSATVQGKGILSGVVDKLRLKFDALFLKVEAVKAKFTQARQALMTAIAKLDHNIPEQAAMIQQIMAQMARIDAMERQFSASMHLLAGKLDLLVVALDKIISGATNFIPGFGWIANLFLDYFVMGDVKTFIAEIKMRLLAL